MNPKKFYIASTDGENFVISNDPSRLPEGATPAPLRGRPSMEDLQKLKDYQPGKGSVELLDESGSTLIR